MEADLREAILSGGKPPEGRPEGGRPTAGLPHPSLNLEGAQPQGDQLPAGPTWSRCEFPRGPPDLARIQSHLGPTFREQSPGANIERALVKLTSKEPSYVRLTSKKPTLA